MAREHGAGKSGGVDLNALAKIVGKDAAETFGRQEILYGKLQKTIVTLKTRTGYAASARIHTDYAPLGYQPKSTARFK